MVRPVRLIGDRQRAYAKSLIDGVDDGWIMTLKEPTRSLEQSAKMWAMLGDLSEQKPMGIVETADGWKLLVMHAAGFECQFMQGLDGRPFPTGFRSSRLTVRQMSALIEWMLCFGAEQSVVWTDPNPYAEAAE